MNGADGGRNDEHIDKEPKRTIASETRHHAVCVTRIINISTFFNGLLGGGPKIFHRLSRPATPHLKDAWSSEHSVRIPRKDVEFFNRTAELLLSSEAVL